MKHQTHILSVPESGVRSVCVCVCVCLSLSPFFLSLCLSVSVSLSVTKQTPPPPPPHTHTLTHTVNQRCLCTTPLRMHNIDLGFILDSKLSMKKHVIKICQTAYFELKRISSVRRFRTEDASKTLVTSYILSQPDYSNCLLMGTPNFVNQRLQKISHSFSWHPVTTTQHLSWKNCTGFPFQNVLSIKSLVCVSVL